MHKNDTEEEYDGDNTDSPYQEKAAVEAALNDVLSRYWQPTTVVRDVTDNPCPASSRVGSYSSVGVDTRVSRKGEANQLMAFDRTSQLRLVKIGEALREERSKVVPSCDLVVCPAHEGNVNLGLEEGSFFTDTTLLLQCQPSDWPRAAKDDGCMQSLFLVVSYDTYELEVPEQIKELIGTPNSAGDASNFPFLLGSSRNLIQVPLLSFQKGAVPNDRRVHCKTTLETSVTHVFGTDLAYCVFGPSFCRAHSIPNRHAKQSGSPADGAGRQYPLSNGLFPSQLLQKPPRDGCLIADDKQHISACDAKIDSCVYMMRHFGFFESIKWLGNQLTDGDDMSMQDIKPDFRWRFAMEDAVTKDGILWMDVWDIKTYALKDIMSKQCPNASARIEPDPDLRAHVNASVMRSMVVFGLVEYRVQIEKPDMNPYVGTVNYVAGFSSKVAQMMSWLAYGYRPRSHASEAEQCSAAYSVQTSEPSGGKYIGLDFFSMAGAPADRKLVAFQRSQREYGGPDVHKEDLETVRGEKSKGTSEGDAQRLRTKVGPSNQPYTLPTAEAALVADTEPRCRTAIQTGTGDRKANACPHDAVVIGLLSKAGVKGARRAVARIQESGLPAMSRWLGRISEGLLNTEADSEILQQWARPLAVDTVQLHPASPLRTMKTMAHLRQLNECFGVVAGPVVTARSMTMVSIINDFHLTLFVLWEQLRMVFQSVKMDWLINMDTDVLGDEKWRISAEHVESTMSYYPVHAAPADATDATYKKAYHDNTMKVLLNKLLTSFETVVENLYVARSMHILALTAMEGVLREVEYGMCYQVKVFGSPSSIHQMLGGGEKHAARNTHPVATGSSADAGLSSMAAASSVKEVLVLTYRHATEALDALTNSGLLLRSKYGGTVLGDLSGSGKPCGLASAARLLLDYYAKYPEYGCCMSPGNLIVDDVMRVFDDAIGDIGVHAAELPDPENKTAMLGEQRDSVICKEVEQMLACGISEGNADVSRLEQVLRCTRKGWVNYMCSPDFIDRFFISGVYVCQSAKYLTGKHHLLHPLEFNETWTRAVNDGNKTTVSAVQYDQGTAYIDVRRTEMNKSVESLTRPNEQNEVLAWADERCKMDVQRWMTEAYGIRLVKGHQVPHNGYEGVEHGEYKRPPAWQSATQLNEEPLYVEYLKNCRVGQYGGDQAIKGLHFPEAICRQYRHFDPEDDDLVDAGTGSACCNVLGYTRVDFLKAVGAPKEEFSRCSKPRTHKDRRGNSVLIVRSGDDQEVEMTTATQPPVNDALVRCDELAFNVSKCQYVPDGLMAIRATQEEGKTAAYRTPATNQAGLGRDVAQSSAQGERRTLPENRPHPCLSAENDRLRNRASRKQDLEWDGARALHARRQGKRQLQAHRSSNSPQVFNSLRKGFSHPAQTQCHEQQTEPVTTGTILKIGKKAKFVARSAPLQQGMDQLGSSGDAIQPHANTLPTAVQVGAPVDKSNDGRPSEPGTSQANEVPMPVDWPESFSAALAELDEETDINKSAHHIWVEHMLKNGAPQLRTKGWLGPDENVTDEGPPAITTPASRLQLNSNPVPLRVTTPASQLQMNSEPAFHQRHRAEGRTSIRRRATDDGNASDDSWSSRRPRSLFNHSM